jgi:hypothetical protein
VQASEVGKSEGVRATSSARASVGTADMYKYIGGTAQVTDASLRAIKVCTLDGAGIGLVRRVQPDVGLGFSSQSPELLHAQLLRRLRRETLQPWC